ncbi:unnamed protein product [Gordionus sp. m RMFG-2023]
MGIIRDYLKYVKGPVFNVITGPKGNIIFNKDKNLCLTSSSEDVASYDLKTQEKVKCYYGETSEVTILTNNHTNGDIAVGYRDGSLQVFHINDQESFITFNGHKSSITALNYDIKGYRLISGSQDTNIVVWDMISETGLFKFKGHKGNITQCRFLPTSRRCLLGGISLNLSDDNYICEDIIISSSKDGAMKFWDLNAQHCFKTLFENSLEILDFILIDGTFSRFSENLKSSIDCNNDMVTKKMDILKFRLISLTSENSLKMWDIEKHNSENIKSNSNNTELLKTEEETIVYDSLLDVNYIGQIYRNSKSLGTRLMSDQSFKYIGCHGNDRTLTLYQITPDAKLNKIYRKHKSSLISYNGKELLK